MPQVRIIPSMSAPGIFKPVPPVNEPIRTYAPGTPERASLQLRLEQMKREQPEIPCIIGGKEVNTGTLKRAVMPHDKDHVLANVHQGGAKEVEEAIEAAGEAWEDWHRLPWEERAAVFYRAAELLAGPWRDTLNAATMLGQSKTAHQAEIDAACELIDFWRFNPYFMNRVYEEQPFSGPGSWNRMEYRPLEGFVFAVTPFNFTAIGGNLPTAPALMGNTSVWKPAGTAMLSAYYTMKLLQEAGLPDGVVNLVYGSGKEIGDAALASPELAGVHFTGSTPVFQSMWKTIGANIADYRNYPRIVGETGGKDFIVAHSSADAQALAVAMVRGAFEYQGQKCSAASRVYVPESLWPQVEERAVAMIESVRMGDVQDFRNFMGAVIDEKAFRKISEYIDGARKSGDRVLAGGTARGDTGYFVEPTLVRTSDPSNRLLCEEIFGPVLAAYVYPDAKWDDTLAVIDRTSPYALTGAVFARDRGALVEATSRLRHAAGNFYLNDKPTGAVVGQQPFGGARASGTDDKAGSALNLLRFVAARTIKETFVPATDWRYPYLMDRP